MLKPTTVAILVLSLVLCYLPRDSFQQVPPWDETCETGKYPPKDQSTVVPTYVVNLDLPPEQRWVEIASQYKEEVFLELFLLSFAFLCVFHI